MPFTRLTLSALGSALCAALALALAPTPAVAAGEPTDDREAAERALTVVQEALEPRSPLWRIEDGERPAGPTGDLTMALLELHRRYADLAPGDQEVASRLLARPTDGRSDPIGMGYRDAASTASDCEVAPTPGSRVCITWVTNPKDPDAPPLDDADADGVPDQVETARDTMNNVWDQVVTKGGYLAPLPDGGPAAGDGPDKKLDIYLSDIGGGGYYGYCSIDDSPGRHGGAPAYCVLDDDFSKQDFPVNTPLQNLRVTAAHEFFHAVQYAYDLGEDLWFMEGTAAWIEDELYDGVNDNLQYLAQSPLTDPNLPLDLVSGARNPYGNWVFWRWLTERYPNPLNYASVLPDLVRQVWTRARYVNAASPGTFSSDALVKTLDAAGKSFPALYARFGASGRHPARHGHFEEGAFYPQAPLERRATLARADKRTPWTSMTVRQLGTATAAIKVGRGLRNDRWRVRIQVDGPNQVRSPFALLTTYRSGGAVKTHVVRLDERGVGKRVVPFSTPEVRRVELTVANASTRYDCDRNTLLSCEGKPLHDRSVTKFRAVLVRR